jgi:hypothetical protein
MKYIIVLKLDTESQGTKTTPINPSPHHLRLLLRNVTKLNWCNRCQHFEQQRGIKMCADEKGSPVPPFGTNAAFMRGGRRIEG